MKRTITQQNVISNSVELAQRIKDLEKQLAIKDEQIEHLESLLKDSGGSLIVDPGVQRLQISDEEMIAELQLNRLKEKSQIGALSLEDVRIFDLLVKNKRLAQGNPTTIDADYKKLPKEKTALLKLASSKDSQDE